MTKLPVFHPEGEAVRLHEDWFGQCRTCKHWQAERREALSVKQRGSHDGVCGCEASPGFEKRTGTEDRCEEWDSYDADAALRVMG